MINVTVAGSPKQSVCPVGLAVLWGSFGPVFTDSFLSDQNLHKADKVDRDPLTFSPRPASTDSARMRVPLKRRETIGACSRVPRFHRAACICLLQVCLLYVSATSRAQEIATPIRRLDFIAPSGISFERLPTIGADPPKNTKSNGGGVNNHRETGPDKQTEEEDEEEERPKHIRDNAFLVEEAFNQEPGDVQHIFNWINLWDTAASGRTRDFAWTYTMELPLGTQDHQFSFTTQMFDLFEKSAGVVAREGGIGDTFLNYRYQLLADDNFLWCAPRLTLIAPTGDKRFGLGTGEVGYQFNLPVSRYGEQFDFHFNAGLTYIPDVSLPLPNGFSSPGQDLRAYNLGGSVYWKLETYLHCFVEALALWNEEIDDTGFRTGITQLFLNPGARYAVCQLDQVEWVLGMSAPIGLTPDSPDIGFFAYMSVEHNFRKIENGKK